jgi:hypothetical protein
MGAFADREIPGPGVRFATDPRWAVLNPLEAGQQGGGCRSRDRWRGCRASTVRRRCLAGITLPSTTRACSTTSARWRPLSALKSEISPNPSPEPPTPTRSTLDAHLHADGDGQSQNFNSSGLDSPPCSNFPSRHVEPLLARTPLSRAFPPRSPSASQFVKWLLPASV